MPEPGALSWRAVLEQEYEALCGDLPSDAAAADAGARLADVHRRLHQRRPTALCLSGGGIRSATFGLGVLQGLARIGVLGKLDYLSTVSGGGYVGGWLTSWIRRSTRDRVLAELAAGDATPRRGPAATDSPVNRLRATCRYLAPAGGIVSADVWTLLATMGRNLLLNWFVLLPLLAAVLLVPRIYLASVNLVDNDVLLPAGQACLAYDAAPFWLGLLSLSMFVVATGYIVMNFVGHGESWPQRRFLGLVVAPTIVGTIALTLFWAGYGCAPDEKSAVFISAVVPGAAWLVIGAAGAPGAGTLAVALAAAVISTGALFEVGGLPAGQSPNLLVLWSIPLLLIALAWVRQRLAGGAAPMDRLVGMSAGVRTVTAALVAGPIIGFGSYWFAHKYFYFGDRLGISYAVFAVPGVLALILLSNTVFLGIGSRELTDAALEWWNRFAAWMAIVATLWIAAGVVVFYLADLIELGVRRTSTMLQVEHRTSSALFSVVIPLVSSLAGLAARSNAASDRPSTIRSILQRLTLPAAIVVLLATTAWFDGWAVSGFTAPPPRDAGARLQDVAALAIALTALGLFVSRFVPVNRFSLHGMYRQRLVRTFLGASHTDRRPNAFTGFDPADDLCVHDLRGVRPLHVINATLNNVSASGYGRNERNAYAFTFSPLHAGSPVLGYRPSAEYGSDAGGRGTGLSLGMAMAVSGAAASPAMGMYTSKARAFLLTLANARLGLWFGNPNDRKTWQQSDPTLGVGPLVRELLGLATDRNPYVYLSDGGHFENLGLWSMVARRCGAIIVSDAGCDPDYVFDDLANAVRRVRIDMGIPIDFRSLDITRAGQGSSNPHVVLGTIRYSAVDGPDAPDGFLVYIKATLSGDEPIDVRNFAASHPAFPHDPTGNQFFDEDRFESYRALGCHSILSVAGALIDADPWEFCAAVASAENAATASTSATVASV